MYSRIVGLVGPTILEYMVPPDNFEGGPIFM